MKMFSFFKVFIVMTMLVFLTSCGGDDDSTNTTKDENDIVAIGKSVEILKESKTDRIETAAIVTKIENIESDVRELKSGKGSKEVEKKLTELSIKVAHIEGILNTLVKFSDFTKLKEHVDNINMKVNKNIPTPSALIIQPTGKVSKKYDFIIQISNGDSSKYYYLVHRIGGQYWPKVRLYPDKQGIAIGQSDEGGRPPGGIFYLTVFEVDKNEHQKILKWLNGKDFSGIQIDGTKLVESKVRLVY